MHILDEMRLGLKRPVCRLDVEIVLGAFTNLKYESFVEERKNSLVQYPGDLAYGVNNLSKGKLLSLRQS